MQMEIGIEDHVIEERPETFSQTMRVTMSLAEELSNVNHREEPNSWKDWHCSPSRSARPETKFQTMRVTMLPKEELSIVNHLK